MALVLPYKVNRIVQMKDSHIEDDIKVNLIVLYQ